ncbi:MazG-like protein [Leuconostoc mesenteroides]|uniref:MazG-like protein n=1 Tax=Leuconostoc mesenteroides TaxID=1245 RepID=UPI002362ACB7|nr:MazG-like protein [Leuconostoc mesenteroides]
MEISNLNKRSMKIRNVYHQFEKSLHGSEWSKQEDVLAYLTDAGLIARLFMSKENRWPMSDSPINTKEQFGQKLAENIWWLFVIAGNEGIDLEYELNKFLTSKEKMEK